MTTIASNKVRDMFFEVELHDGIYWIPAEIVCRDRAEYYATQDSKDVNGRINQDTFADVYRNEYDTTDKADIWDWLHNNMNWKDIADSRIWVRAIHTEYDYENEWRDEVAERRVKLVSTSEL